MSVRPHPRKEGWWIIDYYPEGKGKPRSRIPFEGSMLEALTIENSIRTEQKGIGPTVLYPRINEVIPQFIDFFRMDHQPGGVELMIRTITKISRFFGRYQFTSINESLIEQYKKKRLEEGIKRTTINKELSALSGMCKWGKKKGYCQKVPEIERFPNKMIKAPLPVVPCQEDIEMLLAAIPWPKAGIFYCLYYGGLRASEATHLQAENVHLEQRSMHVFGKGGKERVVPILKYLAPILTRRLDEVKTGYLWASEGSGSPLEDLRGCIYWAKRRTGITARITPHLLRHAFGVRAIMSGVHLRTVQIILGHTTSQVTEIYTHLAQSQILSDMDKF